MAAPLTIVDPALFRRACSRFATGITVATVTARDGTPQGLTANSFTSVSCSPPLILICIDQRSSLIPHFRNSNFFGVNILCDSQRDLSVRFAQQADNRFAGIDWRMSDTGVPILEGVLASLECCASQIVEAGDHTLFIGEVVRAECIDGNPLLYYGSAYRGVSDSTDRDSLPGEPPQPVRQTTGDVQRGGPRGKIATHEKFYG